jgi:drug/metabolite transporter (DMT)-like permease
MLYNGGAVSYEERGQWVYLIANVLTFGAYVMFILGRADSLPLASADYVPTMLWTIGIAIALSIAGRIVVEIAARIADEIASDSDAYTADVRDRDIGRLGEYVGGTILGIGMILPFGLALAEFDHFWIANAIYLVFAVSAFVGTIVKLVAYRRGL